MVRLNNTVCTQNTHGRLVRGILNISDTCNVLNLAAASVPQCKTPTQFGSSVQQRWDER